MRNFWQLVVATCMLLTFGAKADVILHAFNWKYSEVTAKADEIKNAGYKEVLISPPLKTETDCGGASCQWWQLYQPLDYRVIDNPLGNKQDLQALIDAMKARGIKVYADIVLNHMANKGWNSLDYPGGKILNEYKNRWDYYQNQKLYDSPYHPLTENFIEGGAQQGGKMGDFHSRQVINDYNNTGQVVSVQTPLVF